MLTHDQRYWHFDREFIRSILVITCAWLESLFNEHLFKRSLPVTGLYK